MRSATLPAGCSPGRRRLTSLRIPRRSTVLNRTGHSSGWSGDVTQSNGIAWSPDGRKMYFIDSATQGVDVFDYEVGTGSASNRRRLVTIERAHGVPDGMTTDSQGNLWVTCFGGAAVRCFSPEGEQLGEVFFPVAQVTSCAFGGPGLSDLYVTSAAYRLSAAQLTGEPHAGATFVCRPGAWACPRPSFAG